MNVLITSAGRRTSLVEAFKQAAREHGGRVVAGDLDGLAPALFLADAAERLPRVTDPAYVPHLLDLVSRHDVRLLVPTIDTELAVLADATDAFAERNCHVNTSTPEFVAITGDKWATATRFAREGVSTPPSWLPHDLEGAPDDLFVKPRAGSASAHTHAVRREALDTVLPSVPDPIVQRRIVGPEYTVDALLDFEGRPLHYVPRLRVRTLAGESIQGVTVDDANFADWLVGALEAAGRLGARGVITLQFFETETEFLLSEINPRFGGGFPLGYAAGGRYPQNLLTLTRGERVEVRLGEYDRGLYMTRANTEYFVRERLWDR